MEDQYPNIRQINCILSHFPADIIVVSPDACQNRFLKTPQNLPAAIWLCIFKVLICFFLFLAQFPVFFNGKHIVSIKTILLRIAQIPAERITREETATLRQCKVSFQKPFPRNNRPAA